MDVCFDRMFEKMVVNVNEWGIIVDHVMGRI